MPEMLHLLNRLAGRCGLRLARCRPPGPQERLVRLRPETAPRGNVLLSYVLDPFLLRPGEAISHDHTHHWESHCIARAFLEQGFAVDVISYLNRTFVPDRDYRYLVAARTGFDRLNALLKPDCVKVAHLDCAHWLFNNHAAYGRLLALQQRRGVTLANIKMIETNLAIENADLATVLGNDFTMDTYRYAGKPLYRIPISTTCLRDWDERRDFDHCRRHFIWLGSSGFVHKGLDLALEAFAGLPDHHLTVCGPLQEEQPFVNAFRRELYHTPNIHPHGWADMCSADFAALALRCVGLVYPTCSEGGGGSVIACMHHGLIPVLTRAASVDLADGGLLLPEASVPAIRHAVQELARRPAAELRNLARRAWSLARERHTRERFAAAYGEFVREVLLPERFRR